MVKTKSFSLVFLIFASLCLGLGAAAVRASTFGSVQGKVTDDSGKPLAGVHVTVAGSVVTTDKSGSYDLEGVVPGDYPLQAALAGYQTTSAAVTITQDVPLEVDLTLSKSGASS